MRNLVNDVNIGENFPSIINCIVEVEKDTNAKYEYVEKYDIFKIDIIDVSQLFMYTKHIFDLKN